MSGRGHPSPFAEPEQGSCSRLHGRIPLGSPL